MKRLGMFTALLSLSMFLMGCGDGTEVKKKDDPAKATDTGTTGDKK